MNKTNSKAADSDKNKHLCTICAKNIIGSTYKFNCHLYQHKAIPARFTCSHCFKGFYRSDEYHRHLSRHTGDYKKLFVCDFCDRSFVDKRNLHHHLKVHDDSFSTHSKAKVYPCMMCEAIYTEERSLKHHIRRMHCNLAEKQPTFLKKQLNESWVERVLNTNTCVKVTKLNNNIISIKKCDEQMSKDISKYFGNMEDTTSQYSNAICDYCKKEMLKKSLRQHIKERHMKIRNFKCTVCKKQFNRHYQLVDHVCGKGRAKGNNTKKKD